MTIKLKPESIVGDRQLTKAEQVILEGLPAVIDSGFSKLITLAFAKGLISTDSDEQELPLEVVVASLYAAAVSVASGRGFLDFDKSKQRLDQLLLRMMKDSKFDVDKKNSLGCGDPSCDACSAANAATKENVNPTAPSSTKVH